MGSLSFGDPVPMHALSLILAYVDPGAGMLMQALVAGIAGLVVFLKYQGRRVLAFFRPRKAAPTEPAEKTDAHEVDGG